MVLQNHNSDGKILGSNSLSLEIIARIFCFVVAANTLQLSRSVRELILSLQIEDDLDIPLVVL